MAETEMTVDLSLELDQTRAKLAEVERKLIACGSENTDLVFKLMTACQMKESLKMSLSECVNELCLKCGQYKNEHLGACDGCRWKAVRHGDFNDAGSD
jgi:hypothetical protein